MQQQLRLSAQSAVARKHLVAVAPMLQAEQVKTVQVSLICPGHAHEGQLVDTLQQLVQMVDMHTFLALQVPFRFADGREQPVPCAYLEFAERAPLPQFAHLPVCTPDPK